MSRLILLDTGPLGMVSNTNASSTNTSCTNWMMKLLTDGYQIFIPEIADYEVRRELLRANKTAGIARLDALQNVLDYLPLTTQTMRKACEFWASVQNQGMPTAHDHALDGDVILAAQADLLSQTLNEQDIVATTNVKHLKLFVDAFEWQLI